MSHLTQQFSAELGMMLGRIRRMVEEHDTQRNLALQAWEEDLRGREERLLERESQLAQREKDLDEKAMSHKDAYTSKRDETVQDHSWCTYRGYYK